MANERKNRRAFRVRWTIVFAAAYFLLLGGLLVFALAPRPMSQSFTLDEGEVYWIAPPLIPAGTGAGIVDAASLEAFIKANGTNVDPSFRLGVARLLQPAGVVQCYPVSNSPCVDCNPSVPCSAPTNSLAWDPSVREGIYVKHENGGQGAVTFTWEGEEDDPPLYGFLAPGGDYLRAIQWDSSAANASDLCGEMLNVSLVSRFDTANGGRIDWICPFGTNFSVVPGESVAFRVNAVTGPLDVAIEGTLYNDIIAPGTYDPPDDTPVAGRSVTAEEQATSAVRTDYTDPDGAFAIYAWEGDYIVRFNTKPGETWTPTEYNLGFLSSGSTSNNNDFARDPIHQGLVDLFIDLPPGIQAPCSTAAAPSNRMEYCVRYRNTGTFDEDHSTATLLLPDVGTQVSYLSSSTIAMCSAPPSALNPPVGNLITWDIPIFDPGQECTVCAEVEVLLPLGGSLQATATFTPSGGGQDTDQHFSRDTCSFDPNDKEATPGCGPSGYFNRGEALTYRVRFQNEGTAAANKVVIRDSLDENLDESSLELVGASHVVTDWGLLTDRIVEFTFDGINLPDETSDPAGSHGFLLFRANHRSGLPEGQEITNAASIVFDLNDPIITNDVLSTLTDNNLPPNDETGAEACDSVDNDCDGVVDAFATACGIGSCASAGTCTAGVDDCVPGIPQPETCDGQDNDCDGVTDIDTVGPVLSVDKLDPVPMVRLSWTTPVTALGSYDVTTGDVQTVRASGGDYSSASCLADDWSGSTLDVNDGLPSAGDSFWYLLRSEDCGGLGSYDIGSPSQVGDRDGGLTACAP